MDIENAHKTAGISGDQVRKKDTKRREEGMCGGKKRLLYVGWRRREMRGRGRGGRSEWRGSSHWVRAFHYWKWDHCPKTDKNIKCFVVLLYCWAGFLQNRGVFYCWYQALYLHSLSVNCLSWVLFCQWRLEWSAAINDMLISYGDILVYCVLFKRPFTIFSSLYFCMQVSFIRANRIIPRKYICTWFSRQLECFHFPFQCSISPDHACRLPINYLSIKPRWFIDTFPRLNWSNLIPSQ